MATLKKLSVIRHVEGRAEKASMRLPGNGRSRFVQALSPSRFAQRAIAICLGVVDDLEATWVRLNT